jgi:hypothetical protein
MSCPGKAYRTARLLVVHPSFPIAMYIPVPVKRRRQPIRAFGHVVRSDHNTVNTLYCTTVVHTVALRTTRLLTINETRGGNLLPVASRMSVQHEYVVVCLTPRCALAHWNQSTTTIYRILLYCIYCTTREGVHSTVCCTTTTYSRLHWNGHPTTLEKVLRRYFISTPYVGDSRVRRHHYLVQINEVLIDIIFAAKNWAEWRNEKKNDKHGF